MSFVDQTIMNQHETEFITIQEQLRDKIELTNNFDPKAVKLVAGVDIAYWTESGTDYGVCCIVVVDYHRKKAVEEVSFLGNITVPYIPNFLAFRELPLVLETVRKLASKPDVYMFDGNGYLHVRHMGIATHASFHLNTPTIGVAKQYLKINNTDFIQPENQKGAYTDIVIEDEIYGRVLCTREQVKPVFVSCGNWIDLDTATDITLHLVENNSRLPVTTRYADLVTHRERAKFTSKI